MTLIPRTSREYAPLALPVIVHVMTRVVKSVLAGILRVPTPLALDEPETMVHRRSTRLTNCQFTPFGGERPYTNTCSQNYKFEGKERDTETGNDDFGARYYSNRFGRWLSADWSAVPVAVPYATLANPQTLNLYSMVSDDPETSADLDGHCPFCLGALAVAGGGTLETAGAVA